MAQVLERERIKSRTITFLPPGVSSPGCWPSLGLLCPISTKVIYSGCKLLDSMGEYPHKLLCLHVTQVSSRDTDANWHPGSFPHRVASRCMFMFCLFKNPSNQKNFRSGLTEIPCLLPLNAGARTPGDVYKCSPGTLLSLLCQDLP